MEVKQGHPTAIYTLFLTEMWERFSYYGMRALLIFYMTQTFLFSDDRAYGIYGAYTALVYLAPLFGGIVADRLLGYRKGIIAGATLMALGHFAMAFQNTTIFYGALALLIVGNGFFKPNMSTIVGKLYDEGDPRRDSGYTIFYMGVNLGALLAPIGCGWVGGRYGWHWGFTLAGIGMVFGLITFLMTQKLLGGRGEAPDPQRLRRPVLLGLNLEMLIYLGGVAAIALAWKMVQLPELVGNLLTVVAALVLVYLLFHSFARCTPVARHRLWVAMVLTVFAVVFWAFFEQAGSSMNLFTERNVDKVVAGWEVPAPVMQSINPAFILLLGSLFAALWVRLARVDANPSIPFKFGIGIVQLGLGFGLLYYGAWVSQENGIVGLIWLVLGYLFHTTGELCISPVGLSMISKLSPAKMTGFMMGTWYLSISYAQYLASLIAQLTSVDSVGGAAAATELDPVDTVMIYGSVFGQLALIAVGVGVVLMLLSRLINRGTHGVV